MGSRSSKSSLRSAIIYLNISADEISADNDKFWDQIFSEDVSVANEVIKNITVQEIRMLRDGSPKNFATLAYKMVERLSLATGTLCNTQDQQAAVLNSIKILVRMLPCIFEDPMWRYFFEINSISSSEDLRRQPQLKYPEKKLSERNYTAYVPIKLGSRSVTPNDKQDSDDGPQHYHHHHDTISIDSSAQANTSQGRDPYGGEESPISEQLLLTDIIVDGSASQSIGGSYRKSTETLIKQVAPNERSLMKTLILSICDLLFCPEFTVLSHGDSYLANAVDAPPEDLKSLSTHDYVWEPGVGFDSNVNSTTCYDKNRSELLSALLVCLSVTLYETPEKSIKLRNNWMEVFVSKENRHTLPLFTSLLNVVFIYKPSRPLLQFNSLLLTESNRERLVEISCQLLIAVLDYNIIVDDDDDCGGERTNCDDKRNNSFIEYMSRIHREEDLVFLIKGFIRLLKNNLEQGNLWMSTRTHIELDQELQILLWKICNLNKRFIQFLLKSNDVLDIVVPILYHLNENFQEPSRTALIHMGVFNLLLLSSERNFGVRLNKQYSANLLGNLPEFSGSHADLMILVFHKLIMYGYKINQLYDYLLTVLVNVSPYLKGATILACKCLIQLFETFSSVFVLFTEPNYHQLVIFLLEIFNNLIQYQFDGNANLVYMILTRKELFINLVNLPTGQKYIDKVLRRLAKQKQRFEQQQQQLNKPQQQQQQHLSQGDGASERNSGKNLNDNQPIRPVDTKINDEKNIGPDLILATVSCSNNESSSSKSITRQEVSLVATPDLHHTTHPVHPFDFANNSSNSASSVTNPIERSNNNSSNNSNKNQDNLDTKISLDDILNERDDGTDVMTLAFDTETTGTGGGCKLDNEMMTSEVGSLLIGKSQESLLDGNNKAPAVATSKQARKTFTHSSSVSSGGSSNTGLQANKWAPTSSWLIEWKQTLPLETIHRMVCALEPQLEQLRLSRGGTIDECEIIKFLQNGTLVGLLPVPHPIQIRKYKTNDGSTMWLRACTWGIIYVRSTIWTGTDIRLIKIL